jgi:chromate transport protein ChrA
VTAWENINGNFTNESISKWLFRCLAGLGTATPPAIMIWLQDILVQHITALSPVKLVYIGAALLLIIMALLAYSFLQYPWLKWDELTGTWVS